MAGHTPWAQIKRKGRGDVLAELSQLSQDMGLYDHEPPTAEEVAAYPARVEALRARGLPVSEREDE